MLNKYRLVVCVEYKGTNYSGWQFQNINDNSIQNIIEKSLCLLIKEKIKIFCSSRTDIGVHSLGQIFHFDINKIINVDKLLYKINFILPNDINFKWIRYIYNNFHARYSAISRRYIYIICLSKIHSSFLYRLVTYYNENLDIDLMYKSSRFLIGRHNFNSFISSKCESNNFYRNIFFINIFKKNDFIYFDIEANSFLYHMIRKIISCLLMVGSKKYSLYWLKDFLYYRNNKIFNINIIKPYGLYLLNVKY